jgi:hypothetical protein
MVDPAENLSIKFIEYNVPETKKKHSPPERDLFKSKSYI